MQSGDNTSPDSPCSPGPKSPSSHPVCHEGGEGHVGDSHQPKGLLPAPGREDLSHQKRARGEKGDEDGEGTEDGDAKSAVYGRLGFSQVLFTHTIYV